MTIIETAKVTLAGMFYILLLQMAGCTTPQEVAQNSLVDLYKHGESTEHTDDEAFAKDIGFNSLEEVADAQLGSPLRIYTIPLLQLQGFQPSDDPGKLLMDTNRIIFPLIVNGQFRSALIVRDDSVFSLLKNGNWKGMRLRLKNLDWKGLRTIEMGFKRLMPEIQKLMPTSSSFLVSIASLRLIMLADRKAERLVLTAIEENPYFSLNVDAAELFAKIAPHAHRIYESDQRLRQESPDKPPSKSPNTERALYPR